jgi:uncharacterized Zn finger protein (UPF0148 family)
LHKENNDETIKRMADLLRQGTTLTDLSCPACTSPLFRLKDQTLWCAKDQKKVIIVKKGDNERRTKNPKYTKIEQTLLSKVEKLQVRIENTEDIDELQKLVIALSEILTTLEKIKKMKEN